MNEVRESYARPVKDATFPFDASAFDPTPKVKHKSRKRATPKVTATGHLIRDGRIEMSPVPNFEMLLSNMRTNKAEVGLPVRTVFVGAQMLAAQSLLAQPGVLGTSVLSPGQSVAGPLGTLETLPRLGTPVHRVDRVCRVSLVGMRTRARVGPVMIRWIHKLVDPHVVVELERRFRVHPHHHHHRAKQKRSWPPLNRCSARRWRRNATARLPVRLN